jgi:hypothetical protein
MVLPKYTPRGGFKRPIRIGEFIRDFLTNGPAYGEEIYRAYKLHVQNISYTDPRKHGLKRRCIAYSGFRIYLNLARRCGLIEYVNADGSPVVGSPVSEPSDNPNLAGRLYVALQPGAAGSSDWFDLFTAAKGR